jgi:hypothetical protein
MTRVTRRRFLRAGGAAVATGVTATTLSGSAAAAHDDALPPYVELTYDQTQMEKFRPLLDVPSTAEFSSPELYGWIAKSAEDDLDAYVYFAFYQGQRGWSYADSHLGDREPFVVYVQPDFEEVRAVSYSGWHWMRASSRSMHLYEPDGTDESHPTARVYPTHHHYALTESDSGALFPVSSLGTSQDAPFEPDAGSDVQFERWLADGWEEALHPGAAQNPWIMAPGGRDSWWREDSERVARAIWSAQLQVAQLGINPGFGGFEAATTSDLADN